MICDEYVTSCFENRIVGFQLLWKAITKHVKAKSSAEDLRYTLDESTMQHHGLEMPKEMRPVRLPPFVYPRTQPARVLPAEALSALPACSSRSSGLMFRGTALVNVKMPITILRGTQSN